MSRQAVINAHSRLIARFKALKTADELERFLAAVVELPKPGFPANLADGDYFDGAYLATVRGGEHAMTLVLGRPAEYDHIWPLWDQMASRRTDDLAAQRDAGRDADDDELASRRGRPQIGRPVQIRLPEWLLRLVDQYADANDLTRAEAARKLIVAGHQAIKAQV